jgi:hypothetical protein
MSSPQALMDRTNNLISVIELKRLLIDLKEKRPGICVRFRLMGELWARNFMSIAGVTDKGVVLKDSPNNNFIAISNLSDIMQFEIDEPFQGFRPYNHYDIVLSQEFSI